MCDNEIFVLSLMKLVSYLEILEQWLKQCFN